ncbi:hypothetical protein [Streptomyces luteocolor]|uniref:hypothetical protein n=1 Tax=Streptomyces luteocolor TaxID=285500 RepID=UPI000853AFE8|nr:hypothetical protein [Streptomyces luteocolor]
MTARLSPQRDLAKAFHGASREELVKLVLGERARADANGRRADSMEADLGEAGGELAAVRADLAEARQRLAAVQATSKQLLRRVRELERPMVEAHRNEVRQSFVELLTACEEAKDYEGGFDVQCLLREHEEQWKRDDEGAAR